MTQRVVVEPLFGRSAANGARRRERLGKVDYNLFFEPTGCAPRPTSADVRRDLIFERSSNPCIELGARMTAMGLRDDERKGNDRLAHAVYNVARQAAITKELMEIIGGAEALKE